MRVIDNKKLTLSICFSLLLLPLFSQQTFLFQHKAGDQYRILSTVTEDVYFNGKYHQSSVITNKVAVRVTKVANDVASIAADFYVTDSINHETYVFNALSKHYKSYFKRNQYGYYYDDASAFMPVVRNVPLFTNRQIEIDESWASKAYEVHDFSAAPYNITTPYKFPIDVNYTYLGQTNREGALLDIIQIEYKVFHNDEYSARVRNIRPLRIYGESKQTLLWDNNLGRPHSYQESFHLVLQNNDGNEIEYRGKASAVIINSPELDYNKVINEIDRELNRQDELEYSIKRNDDGISISLNNILFYPDSAIMLPGQEGVLDNLSRIFKKYPERDLLVIGHTALAGTPQGQLELSEARAIAVSRELLQRNVRTSDRIFIEGRGATQPVASNQTEEGKKQNRRVEIIILEN